MSRNSWFSSMLGMLVIALTLFSGSAAAQQSGRPEILLDAQGEQLDARQQRFLSVLQAEPSTVETRLVRVANLNALRSGKPFFMTLFRDEGVAADVQRLQQRGPGAYSVFATFPDEDGYAVLVLEGGDVTGTVSTPGGTFRIHPLTRGLHAVVRIDASAFPPEAEPLGGSAASATAGAAQGAIEQSVAGLLRERAAGGDPDLGSDSDSGSLESVTAASGGTVIKVMVAYTPRAASKYVNITSEIQSAVDITNWTYSNSGVLIDLVLAYTTQVSYTESGSHSTDLSRFRGTTDGYMDGVHSQRNSYAADVMILIVDDAFYCGLASAIPATATTAFATVHYSCAVSNYTFAHEIGHLQGARHDNDPGTTPYAYGHGYCDYTGGWRTVMAVGCYTLNRIAHWSNPNVFWYGRVTGTTTHNDNARVLNNTRGTVAGFRSEPVFSVSISGPTSLAYKELGTWTANPSNAPGAVTYRWYESSNGSTYYDLGITTQSISRRGYETFWLKVVATSGGQVKSATRQVWVQGSCSDPSQIICEQPY